mmetsp:Transcript_30727/g.73805  ORF Transcript_30727/g.73805 Transcript_30727/m.73805 type:complete len:294 (+) Transcript_30727:1554-2435(+)
MLFELLVVGEGDAVDALQRVVRRLSLPVRGRVLHDGEGLDLGGVGHVGAAAQIDQVAAAVGRAHRPVRNLPLQNVHLEVVVLEHLQGLVLGHFDALERVLPLNNLVEARLDVVVVCRRNRGPSAVHVVVEPVLNGGSDAEVRAVLVLEGQPQHVRAGVPEGLAANRMVELAQLELAVALERTLQIPRLAVNSGDHRVLSKSLRDAHGDVVRRGLSPHSLLDITVRQSDLDRVLGQSSLLCCTLGLGLLENLETPLLEIRLLPRSEGLPLRVGGDQAFGLRSHSLKLVTRAESL